MKIRVKTLDSRDFDLELDSFDVTVSVLRDRIQENIGIVADRQRLIYQGRPLTDNNRTLASYGLQDGFVIHLVERSADSRPSSDRLPVRLRHGPLPTRDTDDAGDNVVVTTLPVERSGIFENSEALQLLVQRSIENAYPLQSDREGIRVNFDSEGFLSIRLPANTNPSVDSPSAERMNMIREHSAHIRAFFSVVERDRGVVSLVDQIISGAPRVQEESEQRAQTEELVSWVREIERTGNREAVKTPTGGSPSEMEVDGENSTESARYHQNEGPSEHGQRYRMRHALASDLTAVLSELGQFHTQLSPHLERYMRVLDCPLLFDLDDDERLLADSRANALTIYLEMVQRVLHRLGHITHIVSDLNIHLNDAQPRRLYPQYQAYAVEIPSEGELILQLQPPPATGPQQIERTVPADQLITLPNEGRPHRVPSVLRPGGGAQPVVVQRGNQIRSGFMVPVGASVTFPNGSTVNTVPNVTGAIQTGAQPPAVASLSIQRSNLGTILSGGSEGNLANHILQNIREQVEHPVESTGNPYQDIFRNLLELVVERSLGGQLDNDERTREQLANVSNLAQNMLDTVSTIFTPATAQRAAASGQQTSSSESQQGTQPQSQMRIASSRNRPSSAPQMPGGVNISNILSSVLGTLGNLSSGQQHAAIMANAGHPHIHVHSMGHGHSHGEPSQASQVPLPASSSLLAGMPPPRVLSVPTPQSVQQRRGPIAGAVQISGDNLVQLLQSGSIPVLPAGLDIPGLPTNDEGAESDPFLTCSSRHVQGARRNHVHYNRLMEQVQEEEQPPASVSTNPQLAREAAELHIARNHSGHVVFSNSESDAENFVNFVGLALRSVRGLMEENDRENNGPFTNPQFFGGIVEGRPQATIEITAEEVQVPVMNISQRIMPLPRGHTTNRPLSLNSQGTTPPLNLNLDAVPQASANVLRQLFQSTSNNSNLPVGNLLSGLGQERSVNPNSMIGVIDGIVTDLFGVMDLVQLMSGRLDPLRTHRVAIRRYLVTNQLNGNSNPSREDLVSASRRMATSHNDLASFIEAGNGALSATWKGKGYDLVETSIRIEQATILDLMSALFNPSVSDEQFATHVREGLTLYARRMIVAGNMSMGDVHNVHAYERLLVGHLNRDGESLLGAGNSSTIEWMRTVALEQLRNMLQMGGGPLSPNDLADLLVPLCGESAAKKMKHTHDHEHPQTSTAELSAGQSILNSSSSTNSNSSGTIHFDGPMRRATGNDDNGEWRSQVPESWIETISADIERMAAMPTSYPAPSDMYQLSSGRERFCQIPQNPDPNMVANAAVQSAVEDACEAAGELVPDSLRSALSPEQLSEVRDQINQLIRERLSNDPDFEPTQFPNLAKFYKNEK